MQSAWDTGELADDPQLQVFGEQLDSTQAPPAVPTWEQIAAVVDSEIEKATAATPRRRKRSRPCRSRRRPSAPVSDMSTQASTLIGPKSTLAARRPHAAAAGRRRVGARPAVRAVVPRVHGGAGARQSRDVVHRHEAHRHAQPVRGASSWAWTTTSSCVADPLFLKVTLNTLLYLVIGVPLTMAVALAVAVLINGVPPAKGFFRVGYYLPVVTSIVAVSVVWKFLYRDNGGLFNTVLGWVGDQRPRVARQHHAGAADACPAVAPSADELALEARERRLLPGAGELPLEAILQAVGAGRSIDAEVPLGHAMPDLTPLERARRIHAATARVLVAGRQQIEN